MEETQLHPVAVVQKLGRPLMIGFALLLLLASFWGIRDLLDLWDRSVDFVEGTPGEIREERTGGQVRYLLPFTVKGTDQELELQVMNNGPAMNYFMDDQPKPPLAILYWTDDLSVAEVHPLIAGEKPVRDRYPDFDILLATSILGIVLALVLLLVRPLEHILYQLTQR